MKTMMGWVVTALTLTAVLAVPSDAQSQASTGALRAAELESEASRLHIQPDQWVYAAALYMAAVQLREDDDPRVQEDLLLAFNLRYGTGNTAGTMAALESVGDRALASGDIVRAADMFADAARVAKKAGLTITERRLTVKSVELAESSELTRADRREILSRFRGR